MHLEFGAAQKPAVMQSLKQSNLYGLGCAKNACANRLAEAHQRDGTRAAPAG